MGQLCLRYCLRWYVGALGPQGGPLLGTSDRLNLVEGLRSRVEVLGLRVYKGVALRV